jgi:hypothetical protein
MKQSHEGVAEDPPTELAVDVDGDGRISASEINLCKLCIGAAIIIAFGDKAIQFI